MYFLRPGHKEFLLKLFAHPRIKLAFYSSIMFKNIWPVMERVLIDDLLPIKETFMVFDQKYNKLMNDHPYYKQLMKNTYD